MFRCMMTASSDSASTFPAALTVDNLLRFLPVACSWSLQVSFYLYGFRSPIVGVSCITMSHHRSAMLVFPYTQALLWPHPSFITTFEGEILMEPFGPSMPGLCHTYRTARIKPEQNPLQQAVCKRLQTACVWGSKQEGVHWMQGLFFSNQQ